MTGCIDSVYVVEALAQHEVVHGLHFNLVNARARRWLLEATFLPAALREVLLEHDGNRRIEPTDDGLLLVVSACTYPASQPLGRAA